MSASSATPIDAIAFRIAAALDRYDEGIARVIDTWLDMELYRAVSQQVEEIRLHCASLPELSMPWAELLIAHAELVHCLWRNGFGEALAGAGRLDAVRARHAACVQSLRDRCMGLLAGGPPGMRHNPGITGEGGHP